MLAGIAEDLDHQVGDAIGNLRLIGEIRHRIDEDIELDAALDAVEIAAQRRLDLGQDVETADPRRLLALLDAVFLAELADELEFAVPDRHLPPWAARSSSPPAASRSFRP